MGQELKSDDNYPTDEAEVTEESSEYSSDDEFEDQGSSSDEGEGRDDAEETNDDLTQVEQTYMKMRLDREQIMQKMRSDGTLEKAKRLHVDDLSSDDEQVIN